LVKGRNLEFGKIEALAKHIDAHDNPGVPSPQLLQTRLPLHLSDLAMNENRVKPSALRKSDPLVLARSDPGQEQY
jgi:hypothetical protein